MSASGPSGPLVFLKYLQKNSKTSKVNQQSVLYIYIYHHFPKNLHRTITFNSVTFKYTQIEPQKILFFSTNQIIFRVGG